MKLFLFLFIIFTGLSLNSPAQKVIDVSFDELVVTPGRYDGQTVRMHCYLNLDFEGNGIYATVTDRRNALLVSFRLKQVVRKNAHQYSHKNVIITGMFRMIVRGHQSYLTEGKQIKYAGRVRIIKIEFE